MTRLRYTQNPEWRSLLAEIGLNPGDDLPRLVAADWLDEQGESDRAEFIRLQCELARLQSPTQESNIEVVDAIRHMKRRAKQLLLGPERSWDPAWNWTGKVTSELIPANADLFDHVTFRRGFVSDVYTRMSLWLQHGQTTVLENPIEHVRILNRVPGHLDLGFDSETHCCWFKMSWMVSTAHLTEDNMRHALPYKIFAKLAEAGIGVPGEPWLFRSIPEAEDALSTACIYWAKSLPPIPRHKTHWWGVTVLDDGNN